LNIKGVKGIMAVMVEYAGFHIRGAYYVEEEQHLDPAVLLLLRRQRLGVTCHETNVTGDMLHVTRHTLHATRRTIKVNCYAITCPSSAQPASSLTHI